MNDQIADDPYQGFELQLGNYHESIKSWKKSFGDKDMIITITSANTDNPAVSVSCNGFSLMANKQCWDEFNANMHIWDYILRVMVPEVAKEVNIQII